MIDLKQIKEIVYQIFSESGYSINNINIQFPQPLDVNISKNKESISLDFTKKTPKFSWKKIITLSAYINGITLNQDGGVLKLRYLPDIKFSYEKKQELMFGNYFDFSDIQEEIESEYKDAARKKLASRCLQYGTEWVTIASCNEEFIGSSAEQQRVLKQECKNFVKENLLEENKHNSAILTFILIYVLLPVVLKFIVERIFKRIFN